MRKRYAVFVSLLVTLLVAGNYLFFASVYTERESVIISRVIDGDTVELEDGRTIRLLNINTPERGRAFSEESIEFLKKYENKSVGLETEGVGSYGRTLGRIFSGNTYLNLEIVERGLAHKYLVDDNEIKEFEKAEEEARDKERGIWTKSDNYQCVKADIVKKDEYAIIHNLCGLDFRGFTLKDESTRMYKFTKTFDSEITLYSASGTDNEEEVYWGRGKAWNDDKDSIFIRDKEGYLVYYDSYGY